MTDKTQQNEKQQENEVLSDEQLEQVEGGISNIRQEQLNNKYPENLKVDAKLVDFIL